MQYNILVISLLYPPPTELHLQYTDTVLENIFFRCSILILASVESN